jgi:glutamate synthase domain-containing protein 1
MANFKSYENPYGDDKVSSACGLFGIMDVTGRRFSGHDIILGMNNKEERGNGLGAGFAAYGCYPKYADCYAFHVMYTEPETRLQVEAFLHEHFTMVHHEEVPHQLTVDLPNAPLIWRYFLRVDETRGEAALVDEREYVVSKVMEVNTAGQGAYIYSSGKDLGVFKGVGHPEQIAEYFGLEEYSGYLWTAHTRFPTNTPGWWGGAHPFCILDWTVVQTGRSLRTARTAAILRCRDTTAPCRPTPR